jgi:hypothetical protein
VQESEEWERKEGRERVLEKRRGTSASLYLAKGWLEDEGSSDTMPDAAGGEAKPDAVIHGYISTPLRLYGPPSQTLGFRVRSIRHS